MDLREKKTKRSIANAFCQLRQKKPLEKMTVKELAGVAEISKATFYLHYRDLYDLSEKLQNEVIQQIIHSIAHPEYCLTDQRQFTVELFQAFHAQQDQIEILFSGAQGNVLPLQVERELRAFIQQRFHALNAEENMLLTYKIQGSYHVYQTFAKAYPMEEIIALVSRASEAIS